MWNTIYKLASGALFYLWTFALVFIIVKWYRWWKSPHPRYPPGFKGFPFLGVLPIAKPVEQQMLDWVKDLGYIVGIKIMHFNAVFLLKYEDIHDAFTKNGSVMSDRPKIAVLNDVNEGYGLVEKNYNAICKAHRKFANSLFKGFLCSTINIESICKMEAKHCIQHLLNRPVGEPFDPRPDFFRLTANVICRIAFGKRYNYGDPEFQSIIRCSTETLGNPSQASLLFACIMVPYFRFIPPFRKVYMHYLDLNQQILDYIELKIKEHQQIVDDHEPMDFIEAYLRQRSSASNDSKEMLTDSELRGFVKDLFLAGTDTSSNTLAWAFAILLNYPECQERLRKEIDGLLGTETEVGLEHRESLPYCCAFIQEVMRFRTLVPTGVPHQTSKDVNFKQFHFPKNTMVSANLWAVHNDPENWVDPHLFKPERHLDEDGNFVSSPRVIPFSIGLRRCIGERIARTEIFIFFVTVLQHFHVSPDPTSDKVPDIDKAVQLITYTPVQYNLVLKQRFNP